MANPRRIFLVLAVLVAAVVALVWYRFAPGEAPPGQPPLVTLDAASLESLRADFNRAADRVRIIVLLSPT